MKVAIPCSKPRNKALNDVLRSRKGGSMYDPRRFVRAKEKQRALREDA